MRVAKVLSSSITAVALAFSMLATATPAAAIPGVHAAYFSESSFLSLAQGQTGQFAVGYSNTGDVAWVKGSATQQISLYTRNGSPGLFNAGWASGWVSPTVYANQANDLVAPGQVGFMIYNIQVPPGAATGEQRFTGYEVVNGLVLEDFGYYQSVNVTGAAIKITGSTPASPATNATPVISGTGATPTTTVSVMEGSTTLCTSTASSTGTFTCTVTTLSAGSHTITATAPGQGTSAAFTYVVDTAAPALVSVDTAQGLGRVNICFNKAMKVGGPFDVAQYTSYTLSSFGAFSATNTQNTVVSADSKCVLVVLVGTNTLSNSTTYTLTVTGNVADAAGNKLPASSNVTFSTADTGSPTATGVRQPGNQSVYVSFSEAILSTTVTAANFKWDSASFPGATPTIRSATADLTNREVRLEFGTSSIQSTGTHTLDVWDVTDLAGNKISPNPTSFTVTIVSDTTRPTVTSATVARTDNGTTTGYDNQISVNFSEGMKRGTPWGTTNALDTTANYALTNPDGSSATTGCASGQGTALTVSAASLSAVSTARWENKTVRLTLNGFLGSGCSYTLTVSNVQDQAGNALNPNPTLVTITDTADTSAFNAASATVSASQLTVCYSKTIFSSVAAHADSNGQSNVTAAATANYVLTNSSGTTITLTYSVLTFDGKCAVFTTGSTLTSGTYTVTISNVTDPAANDVSPNPTSVTASFSDSTAPTLTSATFVSINSLTVLFSKAMTGGAAASNSAGNTTNYAFNNSTYGNVCTTGTPIITASTDLKTFTVTCDGTNVAGGGNGTWNDTATGSSVQVRNVADQNGNVISPNPSTASF